MHAQLSEAIDDYLRYRKELIAKSTLNAERSVLRRFLTVNGNIWVHSIDIHHVTRFREETGKTKQPQSMANDHNYLKGFFDWAKETKRMSRDANPMYGWRRPRKIKRERNRLHVSKFPALLDAAEARCERDRAAIALLLYTLGRDGEITTLRIRDLDLSAGYIRYQVHKTYQEDRVPICQELDDELRRWLTYYTEQVGTLEPHYYLIPARKTRGVKEEAIPGRYLAVEHLGLRPEKRMHSLHPAVAPALKDIGFPLVDEDGRKLGEGSHTIRRSGARALFDRLVSEGYDGALRVLMSLLHHSSVQTTETYLGLSADRRTRDELIRGRRLYDLGDNVTQLHRSDSGNEDEHRQIV